MNFDDLTLRTASSRNGEPTITAKDSSVTSFGNGKNEETRDSDVAQILLWKHYYCSNHHRPINYCASDR